MYCVQLRQQRALVVTGWKLIPCPFRADIPHCGCGHHEAHWRLESKQFTLCPPSPPPPPPRDVIVDTLRLHDVTALQGTQWVRFHCFNQLNANLQFAPFSYLRRSQCLGYFTLLPNRVPGT